MNKVRIDTEHLRQYVTDAELQQMFQATGGVAADYVLRAFEQIKRILLLRELPVCDNYG